MPAPRPEWLATTIGAVREVMLKRLQEGTLNGEAGKDVEMALEELDVMWEELQGQAALLSRERERYSEFFDYAPDAYLITDAGGNVREANRAALELLAAPQDALLGKPLSEFIVQDERVGFLSHFVGTVIKPEDRPQSWHSAVQPMRGAPLAASLSVRGIPLRKSGVRGLCWLIRPL